MHDGHGRSCFVQRVQAQQLKDGDDLYYHGLNGLVPVRLRASDKATGKGKGKGKGNAGLWSLDLSDGHGHQNVPPRKFYNRILPA